MRIGHTHVSRSQVLILIIGNVIYDLVGLVINHQWCLTTMPLREFALLLELLQVAQLYLWYFHHFICSLTLPKLFS